MLTDIIYIKMKRYKMLGVGGYTIVEALIFLAVSGAILISTLGLVNGRQEKTRFQQAVSETDQILQDIFNDVSTGFYPSSSNISCSTDLSTGKIITITGLDSEQGTNTGCVFIGKFIDFGINSSIMNIYTMVGSTKTTSLSDTNIKFLGSGGTAGIVDQKTNQADLEVNKIINPTTNKTYKSLIILSDLGSDTGGASISGNASKLKLYGYDGNIQDPIVPANVYPINDPFVVCMSQPGNDTSRRSMITITPQLTTDRIIGSWGPLC